MARIVVGTSGWHYASWRGAFFPSGLLIKHQLPYYATQFETTELNGVFYRTPTEAAVRSWRDQTGPDFVFAWKASKFITHWKRLSERSVNSIALMEGRMALLGDKAGPVLFQLPPHFEANPDRLRSFLPLLPTHRRYSFEFRHPSWYTPSIIRLLREANISLCLSDHHDAPAPWKRTADFVYVRGHGPGGRYKDNYPAAKLEEWARRVQAWSAHGIDVYVYFDNDQKSAAPADALRLRAMLGAGYSRSGRSSRRPSAEHRVPLTV
ncbi:DUF72 domain-containing protein [Bradyrhizobium sp. 83012]|uniref:DUF72 domain-containing protein n=1 Tax=Bradyrhizobium aeschynomenes TaxID=2734909 RepID=A0ABX2CAD6_9BRAD|nr:DUF72 domain-containing protein [Bradyrhizobium aeschynomenes]NPU64445.1 DUF72 domain-containing protein [Bradyrhizobium aeschynomenes]